MEIRDVSVDEFLGWPDDRPTDGDMIRELISTARSREAWLFIGYVDDAPTLRIGYRTSPFTHDPTHSGTLPATRLFGIGLEGTEYAELFRTSSNRRFPETCPTTYTFLRRD
jgi:hypothetical protein